jgi:ABC-type transport system substrate-binding protein
VAEKQKMAQKINNDNKPARALIVCALMVACMLVRAAPARAYLPPKFGGTLNVAVPERAAKLDPTLLTQDFEIMIAGCIFNTLVAPGQSGGYTPVLLSELPEKSDDGLTYYFKLREDVKFHDGSILNSAAVLYTFKRLVKNRRSPYSWLLRDVEGAVEYQKDKLPTIIGFKITDPLRFEIRLKQAQPDFIKYLCFPALSILPMADRNFRPPVGTGPFKYEDSTSDGITLTANPDYFLGRPYVESVVFRPISDERNRMTEFKRGAVDVAEAPEGGLSRSENEMFGPAQQSLMKRFYFIDVNTNYAALYMPAQRMALSREIDRDGIVRVILSGYGTPMNNVPGFGDPRALRKSAAAGPELTIWYPRRMAALKLVANKLQQDFARAGVTAKPAGRTDSYMQDYASDNAPAFILRSLPELMGLQESVEKPLFAAGQSALTVAMARRIGNYRDESAKPPFGASIWLFSIKPSYIYQKRVLGISQGPFGAPSLYSVFIREPAKAMGNDSDGKKDETPKQKSGEINKKTPGRKLSAGKNN